MDWDSLYQPTKSEDLVGVEGFEPPTYCSQSNRATRLRYTPLNGLPAVAREGEGWKAREYQRFMA